MTITAVDDAGASPDSAVEVDVPAGRAVSLTTAELESGTGLDGPHGDRVGQRRLDVTSDRPVIVMSLLSSPTRHLTTLSFAPDGGPY